MTQEYLCVFGYETPTQLENNRLHGWDDETSMAIYITAEDEDTALAWCRNVAEKFVQQIFAPKQMSWKEAGYACWVEKDPKSRFGAVELDVERVAIGQYPEFRKIFK